MRTLVTIVFMLVIVSVSWAQVRHVPRRHAPPPAWKAKEIPTEPVQRPVLNKQSLVLQDYYHGRGAAFEGLPISKLLSGPLVKRPTGPIKPLVKRYHWGL